ncbi:hypothetical protein V6N13_015710 [Hibiscus sabdariffa]
MICSSVVFRPNQDGIVGVSLLVHFLGKRQLRARLSEVSSLNNGGVRVLLPNFYPSFNQLDWAGSVRDKITCILIGQPTLLCLLTARGLVKWVGQLRCKSFCPAFRLNESQTVPDQRICSRDTCKRGGTISSTPAPV